MRQKGQLMRNDPWLMMQFAGQEAGFVLLASVISTHVFAGSALTKMMFSCGPVAFDQGFGNRQIQMCCTTCCKQWDQRSNRSIFVVRARQDGQTGRDLEKEA